MFVSFSGFFILLKYFRKACIPFWLLGLLSCKDFKSWESTYAYEVNIKFEPEKEESAPTVLKDLQNDKLSTLSFIKRPTVTKKDVGFLLQNGLSIPLDPNADAVSFELTNAIFHQRVTIYYQRMISLISSKAGGLQIQYVIKHIQFSTKHNTRSIFKKFKIENPVPLQKEKEKTHVTLYY